VAFCTSPAIPAGTSSNPTQILGENFASCTGTNKTQLFGGFGVGAVIDLQNAQFVNIKCIELTSHANCITHGTPNLNPCSTSAPYSDFDSDGARTSATTHDLTLTDVWIHGHTDRGIIGPIGANVTCLRCLISTNGMADWDFDNGSAAPMGTNASWNFLFSTIEWSGCDQQYPPVDAIPVQACFGQSTGGYGDGVGSPAGTGTGMSVVVDHSTFRYNTQDGLDLGHIDAGNNTLSITNSLAYANSGQGFKWGGFFQTASFYNNLIESNCFRLSQPITGAPSGYNSGLTDFCRAQDSLSFNEVDGATINIKFNTIVTYAPTTFDIQCWTVTNCPTAVINVSDNLVLGYDNPSTYSQGGQSGGPAGYCLPGCNSGAATLGALNRDHNLYFGLRTTNLTCPTGFTGEICSNPLLVGQPTANGGAFTEAELDNFNFNLTPGSPALGAGIAVSGVPNDYNGAARPNPPAIGALQLFSSAVQRTVHLIVRGKFSHR
jgi:hypothetical protein